MKAFAGIAALLAAGSLAMAAPAEPDPVQTIALDLSGPRPKAMLRIGSAAPVPVIFDTGASGNVIDADFARSIGLPDQGPAMVGTPAGGTPMRGFRTVIADGRLGDATFTGVRAVALPMPAMRDLSVQAIMGPGTFSGRLVHLDLGRGEIRITGKDPGSIPAGQPFAYSDNGPRSLPGVTVEVAGRSYEGHIDTGQPGTLVFPRALADQLPLDGPLRPAGTARMADGVPRALFQARINGVVRIGPLTFENPEVRFMEGVQRVNVGVAALRGVVVVLDPAERRSWLLPAS